MAKQFNIWVPIHIMFNLKALDHHQTLTSNLIY